MMSGLIVLMVVAFVVIPCLAQPAGQPVPSTQPSPQNVATSFARDVHKALASRRAEYES